jgi:hypothetical protein
MDGFDILDGEGQFVGFTESRETAERDAVGMGGFALDSEGWVYDGVRREYRPLAKIQAAHA